MIQVQQAERRRQNRQAADRPIRVSRVLPFLPVSDAMVTNVSAQGVSIQTRVPVRSGTRLSFSPNDHLPPILAEVLACERIDDDVFRVRCRCLLGSFDVSPGE